jgi:hypothetical protein
MLRVPERDDQFHAEYIPPPPPAPGKILVRAPLDGKGHPVCPDLHLAPEQADQLRNALDQALLAYLESTAKS